MTVHDAWDSRYARWQYVVAFWFAVALALACTSCVRVLPPAEVVAQVRACEARGGVAIPQTVSRYNSAVKWVSCAEAR